MDVSTYRCTRCNYKLEIKEGKKIPNKCPYCDKETLVKDVTASELIRDVDDIL